MELIQKLAILADAAKYDASCASSGTQKRDSRKGAGIGSSGGMGICHSYTPDGRCISLLKVLLTNFCIYECSYCVNRASSNVARARFSIDEVVTLTLDFYKRNYIEGLFLSSGIIQSADYTMEQLVGVARSLRNDYDFRGYIHLKTIPECAPELLQEAGRYADRLSINAELPSRQALTLLAPEKNPATIKAAMGHTHQWEQESKARHRDIAQQQNRITKARLQRSLKREHRFAPAGQSTQMIIGADSSNDAKILTVSHRLYQNFAMRRVYYSAFSPIPSRSSNLPLAPPPLLREHRLYQADWLLRFYDFGLDEIIAPESNAPAGGMLDLDIDPKLAWAIRNVHLFPMDINRAPKELLIRIPGVGVRTVQKIIAQRSVRAMRLEDLAKLRVALDKVKPFICAKGYKPAAKLLEAEHLKAHFVRGQTRQLSLFG